MSRALPFMLIATAIACNQNALPNSGPEAAVDLGRAAPPSVDAGGPDLAAPPLANVCTDPEVAREYGACPPGSRTICMVDDPSAFMETLLECQCNGSQWHCIPNGCQSFGAPGCQGPPPRSDLPCESDFECQYCCGGGTATTLCTCRAGHLPICTIVASCGG